MTTLTLKNWTNWRSLKNSKSLVEYLYFGEDGSLADPSLEVDQKEAGQNEHRNSDQVGREQTSR